MALVTVINPNICHKWAGDDWTQRQQEVYEPRLIPILDLAMIGLELAGLAPPDQVTAQLHRVHDADMKRPGAHLGYCIDDESYAVGVRKRHIWGPQRPALFYQAALHSHEIAHVLRAKRYLWDERLIEYAATEGIAHYVEGSSLREFFGEQHRTHAQLFLAEKSEANMERMRQAFTHSLGYGTAQEFVDAHAMWFIGPQKPGPALGMWCVQGLVNEGASLQDIVEMPAERILGVE